MSVNRNITGNATGSAAGSAAIPGGSRASRDAGDPGNAGSAAGNAAIPGGSVPSPHKGWYSRGYLPHLDQPGLYQSINFRLHDSVPEQVIQKWKEELRWHVHLPNDAPAVRELRRKIVEYEDAGHGECWLLREEIAILVEDALFFFDSQRYRLIAWCIMPNHAHVLIETFLGYPLDTVLHSWKSYTAQEINKLLNRSGAFWARDYYDRYIRDDRHFHQTVAYIEQNPVKANLVKSAVEWKFSSASRRASRDAGDPRNAGNATGSAAIPGGPFASKDAGDPRNAAISGGSLASKDAGDPRNAAIPGGPFASRDAGDPRNVGDPDEEAILWH